MIEYFITAVSSRKTFMMLCVFKDLCIWKYSSLYIIQAGFNFFIEHLLVVAVNRNKLKHVEAILYMHLH